MAEGLLSSTEKGKDLEVGRECFDYLVSRSFFQRSTTKYWNKECFVMHDLIRDLATFLGREFYFTSKEELLRKEIVTRKSSKPRHLSLYKCNDPFLENSEVFERIKFLRTFLSTEFAYYPFNHQEKAV
ncbi:putative disease resistance RPP13-like protein 1, partial [Sesbania bispinosa]